MKNAISRKEKFEFPKTKMVGDVIIGSAKSGQEAFEMISEFMEDIALSVLNEEISQSKFRFFLKNNNKIEELLCKKIYDFFDIPEAELANYSVEEAEQIIREKSKNLIQSIFKRKVFIIFGI